MGRSLSRVAGVVFAGALATFAATPAALAQTETSASPTESTPASTSEPTTTTTVPATPETTAPSSPATTTAATTSAAAKTEDIATTSPKTTSSTPEAAAPPKDDYQDNVGHGFVGLGGEGVLVIACAAGKPGAVATQYLSVTGGPDQDESDGRLWNYSVRVVDAPSGATTAKFSWTCGGVEGNGIVEFEQEAPPSSTTTTTSSASPSSTAPITTATSSGSAPAGNAAPKAQVKVAPKGGVETGFGGTAR